MKTLNCAGCTRCCQSPSYVYLYPEKGDQIHQFQRALVQNMETGKLHMALLKKRNSTSCIYLDEKNGCTIYARRPWMCRRFDCRELAYLHQTAFTKKERDKMKRVNYLDEEVLAQGQKKMRDDDYVRPAP